MESGLSSSYALRKQEIHRYWIIIITNSDALKPNRDWLPRQSTSSNISISHRLFRPSFEVPIRQKPALSVYLS